ncbi:hypothetical protein KZJ38_16395 [Paraburkholderia edwinii]|uniref:Uncharacterized protein n=1 Tax=Paraburkholderia edwinii TaxID=2861782 RepID=A0ABX8UKN6_9BURK|nr:hypothetical protein [Paraburkholderia edwinii]QYD67887.1 hypothetical protein KZJ38_16395 [Paraburkholderia edwinii]
MYRMIPYREFEIHVTLTPSAKDMYEVTMQIKGGANFAIIGESGNAIQLRHGPFTRRWAYLVAEVAGQAAIDVLLGASIDTNGSRLK